MTFIVHVVTTISRGGAENHLVDLVRHQRSQGYRVGVAWLKGTNYWQECLQGLGVTLVDLRADRAIDARAILKLRRMFQRLSPSLVHAHLPPAELYARLALVGLKSDFLVSKHNDSPFYAGFGEEWLGRWVARRAKRVICISEAVAESVARRSLRIESERVRCIPYGLDATNYIKPHDEAAQALRNAWRCDASSVVFGCVARMVSQKDHESLLQAFAQLRAEVGQDAKLVLVGRGPLEDKLRRRVVELGLGDSAVFAGFHENMPAVMQALDVLCLTSLYEGFGLVLIEAMAAGKPVLATRVSAIPEIVQDGRTGVLVPRQGVPAIAQAMRGLLAESTRRAMGSAGRERVRTVFTLEAMCRRTDEVYAELGISAIG